MTVLYLFMNDTVCVWYSSVLSYFTKNNKLGLPNPSAIDSMKHKIIF